MTRSRTQAATLQCRIAIDGVTVPRISPCRNELDDQRRALNTHMGRRVYLIDPGPGEASPIEVGLKLRYSANGVLGKLDRDPMIDRSQKQCLLARSHFGGVQTDCRLTGSI